MALTKQQKLHILSKCKSSFTFFCESFAKIKHPNAGIIPFKLFKYQKKSINLFKTQDRIIYRKCRQSGISTLTGAYALWAAMFHSTRKILIVSKRDEDAIGYLNRNIKFVYENLPSWMYEVFGDPRDSSARRYKPPVAYNEHTISFFNGSEIKSLTSSKDTLRSNTASLVIIDEAAFITEMEAMWTAGQPTLMHGGTVIVISTCNGKGNWYHHTWEDAIAGTNGFTTIEIPWWHMDWAIEFRDKISGKMRRVAPCDNVEKCITKEDKIKFGEFKSPWLVKQYNELQQKNEPWKFRQEILMEFIGVGNTVLSQDAIHRLESQIDNDYKIRNKPVLYNNPHANIENILLDFQGQLYIWALPVLKTPDVVKNNRILKPGDPGHKYVLGADISSGEADDYSSIVVIDETAREEVAELKIKCETNEFAKMIDFIGRLYNNALAVVESTGIGKPICQDLRSIYFYPNLFRRRLPNGKRDKKIGFPTSGSNKSEIVKALTDNMGVEDGVIFKSSRILKEANTFVHLGGGRVGNQPGTDNNDDLMISSGLACIGLIDAALASEDLIPISSKNVDLDLDSKLEVSMDDILKKGGNSLLYPILTGNFEEDNVLTMEQELNKFITQIGGVPMQSNMTRNVVSQKNYFKIEK